MKYSTIVYSSTKKSGKTTIGAAVALWHAFRYPRGDIKIIGNDLKQADSRMMEAIRTCIELNPRMAAAVEQKRLKQTQHRIVLPNKTVIEAIPVDPRGESGSNPSAVFWTEVWAVKYQTGLQMFTEMTLSPTKRGRSFRFIESYAGYVGESPLLEHLYKMGVTNGRRIHDTIELYESADGHLFTYWNTLFRLPWQTDEYYAEEEAILTPSEFRRVHRNEWVSSENEFVPPEWWAACVGDVPPLDKYTPLVVALDAGVVSDTFALVAVSRDGDNVIVRYARAWKPDGKAVDFSEPEADLRRLCAEHNVVYIVYDPYQLADMAQRLRRDVGAVVEPFGQGDERAIADRRLYDMIRARRVVHDGNVLLTEHVTHANAQLSGDRLRLVKRTAGLKIDLAVALSMAAAKIMGLVV